MKKEVTFATPCISVSVYALIECRCLKFVMRRDFSLYSYECSLSIAQLVQTKAPVYLGSHLLYFVWAWVSFSCFVCLFHLQKEDIESALRTSNMNLEDAIELLKNQGRLNVEAWCRHEDHSPFDLPSSHPGAGFPGQRFNPVPQQMSFAPPVCCFMFK
jgi:hypothetical protein